MTSNPFDMMSAPLEGRMLIEASAGTGKTFTIAHLYLRLVLEKSLEVPVILVVTFTDAATRELRDRIRKVLNAAYGVVDGRGACGHEMVGRIVERHLEAAGQQSIRQTLRRALVGFDEASIFTIHGFCQRVLGENSFESAIPFDIELISDQTELLQEVADDFWRKNISDEDAVAGVVARHHGLTPEGLSDLARVIINKPTARIIAEGASVGARDLSRRFSRLCDAWRASGAEAAELLKKAEGLSRGPYKPQSVDACVEKIGHSLSTVPSGDGLRALMMFSSDRISEAVLKNGSMPQHAFFTLCNDFVKMAGRYVDSLKHAFMMSVRAELGKKKRSRNVRSFDDLLLTLRDALRSNGGHALVQAVRKMYRAALIDEFQDTDPVQYEIFNTIFKAPAQRLFLIGDPKQSIYRFRGADVFSYIEASNSTGRQNRYTLNNNWRSDSGFVQGVNYLFGSLRNPFVLGPSIEYHDISADPGSVGNTHRLDVEGDADASLIIWLLRRSEQDKKGGGPSKSDARDQARKAVVAEIARILQLAGRGRAHIGSRAVQPSDIAVLVTRNDDAQLIRDDLSGLNIPAVLNKSGNVFQTAECRELECLLMAVSAPENASRLNSALTTCMIGMSARELRDLLEDDSCAEQYERHVDRFRQYHMLWQSKSFMRMLRACMTDYNIRARLLGLPRGERRLTNLMHLAEIVYRAALEQRLGINGVLRFIADQRSVGREAEETELRLERDDDAVNILTVFKSKGLEYPIVFCPFMWQQGAAPSTREVLFHNNGVECCAVGSSRMNARYMALAGRESLAELVRLLYVAVTRARNRCYITGGKIGNPAASAMDYIFSGGMQPDNDIVTSLMDRTRRMTEDEVCETIQRHAERSGGAVTARETALPDSAPFRSAKPDEALQLEPRRFQGDIQSTWGVASYSLFVASEKSVPAAYGPRDLTSDEPDGQLKGQQVEDEAAQGFFAFPRGAVAGTCVHDILQKIDFGLNDAEALKGVIQTSLANFGFIENGPDRNLVPDVAAMVVKVMNAPLQPNGAAFRLRDIGMQDRISEMQFFMPMALVDRAALQRVFEHVADCEGNGLPDIASAMGGLDFKPVNGYIQGFIDLVVCVEGRYYIIDWKTNHLGNTPGDYRQGCLANTMRHALYHLQYYIYTVALHAYLRSRMSDYEYERSFGGVFYLFVRGIDPAVPGNGIFFDRPSWRSVQHLAALCA